TYIIGKTSNDKPVYALLAEYGDQVSCIYDPDGITFVKMLIENHMCSPYILNFINGEYNMF
ncbi:MAG: hypothetical protein IJ779_04715, partial [Ruminococcus sp.]|nr:hypothetical protein [Ruminococcus sp.]